MKTMKTPLLILLLCVCISVKSQTHRAYLNQKSLQVTANLAYASFGLQYNEDFFKNYTYQLSFESNLYSFSRVTLGIGKKIIEDVYLNVNLAYSAINSYKFASRLNQLSEFVNTERKVKYEITPEVGMFINVNERFTCSVNTDVFQLGGLIRIGIGYSF